MDRPALHRKRRALREDLKAHIDIKSDWGDRMADFFTAQFGSMGFLLVNGLIFLVWIILNTRVLGNEPFDPFPFNLLTMAVSLEAIFLATIVLISQNRQGRIADIREQLDVEIDVRAESEITKVLVMLEEVCEKLGVHLEDDPELKQMEQRTDLQKIRDRIDDGI